MSIFDGKFLAELNDGIQRSATAELESVGALPVSLFGKGTKEILEGFGVIFGEVIESNPLFQSVTLPKGWSFEKTDIQYTTYLLDEYDRLRAEVVYKKCFWDPDAFLRLVTRYRTVRTFKDGGLCYQVLVNGDDKVLWETEILPEFTGERGDSEEEEEEYYLQLDAYSQKKNSLIAQAKEYLNDHYPKWEDPTAYWDG
jgi:hypothetical protein